MVERFRGALALDWMLSENGDSSLIGYLVGISVTLLLPMLKQNYEVVLFFLHFLHFGKIYIKLTS